MPYRVELKRPDLKGQFPCSVCGKIFCHSSSLSRHRMQAHFKSYTCTQCNEEISSNETLRSHMFRAHGISRMFMCRCCNWAFPDKTSLHIHMQSMMRNGDPGDVSVLARSSTEGPGMAGELGGSPLDVDTTHSSPQHTINSHCSSPPPTLPASMTNGSIFPNLPNREELFLRLRERAATTVNGFIGKTTTAAATTTTTTTTTTGLPIIHNNNNNNNNNELLGHGGQWLTNWLANNQFGSNTFNDLVGIQQQLMHNNVSNKNCPLDDDDLEINTMDETVSDDFDTKEEMSAIKVEPTGGYPHSVVVQRSAIIGNPLNSLLYRKKLSTVLRNKRKTSQPRSLSSFMKVEERQRDKFIANGKAGTSGEQQPSPTVSDSQTSASSVPISANGSDGSTSPLKCFECQVLKGKLGMAENRNRFLESKVSSVEAKVGRLESQIGLLEGTGRQYESEQRELRRQCETFEAKLLECQELVGGALGCMYRGPEAIDTVKQMLDNLATTLFRNTVGQ